MNTGPIIVVTGGNGIISEGDAPGLEVDMATVRATLETNALAPSYGDIAPPHVQDPMTMVLRQNAIPADLIRWDDSRAKSVLTGTGRNRITARSRTSSKILRFRMRDEKDGRAPSRKA